MKITILGSKLELTPSIKTYIEKHLGSLKKLIKRFDDEGVAELRVEVGRTSKHHRKGPVFHAEANLRLPKKLLRADNENEDVRGAIDMVEEKLRREIEKYRTQHDPKRAVNLE